ncbi:MAG: HipA family kinase, partial [Streptosporangiaceae bacterium]
MLPQVTAIRYVTPLREGGSLPGLMEADDLGTYVVKFAGAGQGRKALVAEVISAALARACGLAGPDLVAVGLDPALADGEPDQEIQDLLRASAGLNLGVDFLSGAVDFDAAASSVDGALAGRIIWFDALTSNADRSWRNPNMLYWRDRLYLIDHGATLTYQHRWEGAQAAATRPYDISDHA